MNAPTLLPTNTDRAFTLIELLVTVTIIAILGTLIVGVSGRALDNAKMTREISGAKTLITAYTLSATDHDGQLMPGMDMTVNKVWYEPWNRNIGAHPAQRYPFRLAPYFDNRLEGNIIITQKRTQVNGEYMISVFPAFGINYYFVGGLISGSSLAPSLTYPADCLIRQGLSAKPILVFASGGTGAGKDRVNGYNILTPPRTTNLNWSTTEWNKNRDPGMHGNVDARYQGKAICAFTDGSVQQKTLEELSDMRLWNKNAAEQNDPNYLVQTIFDPAYVYANSYVY